MLLLSRWSYSRWPLWMLVSLLLLQYWYSRPPELTEQGLYIRTIPTGVEIYKSEPELFLGIDASMSGGTKESLIGRSPGPLHLSAQDLPMTIVVRMPGYDVFQTHLKTDSFTDRGVYPQILSLKSQNVFVAVKREVERFPFVALAFVLTVLFVIGRRSGKKMQKQTELEQQKLKQGVVSPGTRIGPYLVQERVGSGGMGQVFRVVRDDGNPEALALKLLDGLATSDPQLQKEFLDEVRATAAVNGPGLLFLHDWGEFAQRYYLVTELLRGETLKERLKRGALSWPEVVDLGCEVAETLAQVHVNKMVHRDIKPSNIFLTDTGRVKIMDFGVAATTGEANRKSGTSGYAPPEQFSGQRVDQTVDLYALGVTLAECLLGRPLFAGQGALEFEFAQRNFESLDLPQDTHQGLLELLMESVAPDPTKRPKDANEFLARLEAIKNSDEVASDQ